ncbi:MAG: hypothetical protein A4E35_01027 [Methanoregula sp. PtaU1.Bin051]|nr:MAG: hypothetical protein A4E35_01027 [Methanoregula sp. PtaU1.Bin051]
MIRERIERLKTWAKDSLAAFKARLAAAAGKLMTLFTVSHQIVADLVVLDRIVPNAGKRTRSTSGHAHAPLFSLYTFFKQRD